MAPRKNDGGVLVAAPAVVTESAQDFDEAILQHVLEQIDLSGLSQELARRASERLVRKIEFDELLEKVLAKKEEHLAAQLLERLVAQLA